MRALLCPASLKGVLSAGAAAAALARGARDAGIEAVELPVADGGEGTSESLQSALGGAWRAARVADPLGRPIEARWLELPDGRAVVEVAEAIGLPLLAPAERDPLRASSRGLGELVLAALERSPTSLVVALGGSATVDGGAGLFEVLGAPMRRTSAAAAKRTPSGIFARPGSAGADPGLAPTRVLPVPAVALYDVRTPLADAARLFGPQKGASDEDVAVLERRLGAMEELRPFAELPGSGAAGGLGAALAALGAELVPGAATILDLLGFEERLAGCGVVVTGEGHVDATTLEGKAPSEVARRAAEHGVRCLVFGGHVDTEIAGAETVALSGDPSRAEADLVALGGRLSS